MDNDMDVATNKNLKIKTYRDLFIAPKTGQIGCNANILMDTFLRVTRLTPAGNKLTSIFILQ